MTIEKIRQIYFDVKKDPEAAIDRLMETLTDEQQYLFFELLAQGHIDSLYEHLAEM